MFAGQRMGQRSALDLFSPGSFGKRTRRKSNSILPMGALSKRTWREKAPEAPMRLNLRNRIRVNP